MSDVEIKREKVAIIFGSRPDFDEYAFKYFILQLNRLQSIFEFEFPDVEVQDRDYMFPLGEHYSLDRIFSVLKDARKKRGPAKQVVIASKEDYLISIVSFPLEDELFYDTHGTFAVITTSEWERDYAPPSLFEYLLQSICAVVLLMHPALSDKLKMHNETRGCPFDYTPNKGDNRVDIVLGQLCDECRALIAQNISPAYLDEIVKVFRAEWIGHVDKPDSIAYNLKFYFHFDIDRDSGFRKTFWEKAWDYFPAIPEKIITPALLALGAAVIGFLLGKK